MITLQKPIPTVPQPMAKPRRQAGEIGIVGAILIAISVVFLALFIVVPVISVFYFAFQDGMRGYIAALQDSDAVAAIRLTLLVAAIAVPLNVFFGLVGAWAIGKFRFPGRGLLLSLIELPIAVSPVVAGLIYVMLLGIHGVFGSFIDRHNIQIIFATPGIVLATIFVTFPFALRVMVPLMEAMGDNEEQAAIVLGASGLKTFFRVTAPNIKWGILYGVVLTNARAMGEFGAVSVVSGHIAGVTNTIPLQVETYYQNYNDVGAFALSSLLTLLAIVTLVAKNIMEAG
jgi:sulfate transport system permease protein